jgi:hypothetical protein
VVVEFISSYELNVYQTLKLCGRSLPRGRHGSQHVVVEFISSYELNANHTLKLQGRSLPRGRHGS